MSILDFNLDISDYKPELVYFEDLNLWLYDIDYPDEIDSESGYESGYEFGYESGQESESELDEIPISQSEMIVRDLDLEDSSDPSLQSKLESCYENLTICTVTG